MSFVFTFLLLYRKGFIQIVSVLTLSELIYLFFKRRLGESQDDVLKPLLVRELHRIVRQIRNKLGLKIRNLTRRHLRHWHALNIVWAIWVWVPLFFSFRFPSLKTDRGPCGVRTLIHRTPTLRYILVTVTTTTWRYFFSMGPWQAILCWLILVIKTLCTTWMNVRRFE